MNDERAKGAFWSVGERLAGGGTAAFAAMFNHLLRQNDWARVRLAMFAGRRVAIELETPSFARRLRPPRLAARITGEGLLDTSEAGLVDSPSGASEAGAVESASSGASYGQPMPGTHTIPDDATARADAARFDVEMHVRPSFAAAGALLREGTRGLAPYVRIEGEVMLAAALAEVAERMRWDPEEDLSRITGDVFAHRVGRGVAAAREAMREFRHRVAGSAGRRFAGATGTLVGRDELESLRGSLDALEARVSGLEAKRRRLRAGASADGIRDVEPGTAPQLLAPLELPRLDVDAGEARSETRDATGSDAGRSAGSGSGEADDPAVRRSDSGAGGPRLD